jgi:DinB family protein
MLIKDFNHTIDTWINAIQQYNFEQLCMQPDANSWSIGQVCVHLLNDTNWFIKQIKICLISDDDANETMLPFAQTMFLNNSFPDERLANPANINMPQPQSKEVLLQLFINLKKDMNEAAAQIENSKSKGKTKHPGFNYFNAIEWLQFAEMHLRHHLKQKNSIEKYMNRH